MLCITPLSRACSTASATPGRATTATRSQTLVDPPTVVRVHNSGTVHVETSGEDDDLEETACPPHQGESCPTPLFQRRRELPGDRCGPVHRTRVRSRYPTRQKPVPPLWQVLEGRWGSCTGGVRSRYQNGEPKQRYRTHHHSGEQGVEALNAHLQSRWGSQDVLISKRSPHLSLLHSMLTREPPALSL